MSIYREGYMVPIVDLTCQFKQSLSFGEEAIIETRYIACEAGGRFALRTPVASRARSVSAVIGL